MNVKREEYKKCREKTDIRSCVAKIFFFCFLLVARIFITTHAFTKIVLFKVVAKKRYQLVDISRLHVVKPFVSDIFYSSFKKSVSLHFQRRSP